MKLAILAAALLTSGAAVAQTHSTTAMTQHQDMTSANMQMPGPVVQPSNANPERDARGIPVISDPAVVPAGFNGLAGTAMGGPSADPVTGDEVGPVDGNYPPCTAQVTDNCVQAYERGRSPQ